jgi:hypothetical protein
VSVRLAAAATRLLERRSTRRGFLVRTAVVGSALAVGPLGYLLRPGSAYAAVCGPASSCGAGYTVFCCSLHRGVNKCPPGTFAGGWWRADGSHYCCGPGGTSAPRYYIDCQAICTCSTGGAFCHGCSACPPGCGDVSCDNRRVCTNWFRYGQCHTEIRDSGPVACRMVTCVPPYQLYASCGSTTLFDNATADHTAPCNSPACS